MYNILDFGAKPNTTKVCTSNIQSAIDECSKTGGGRVTIPSGVFIIGTVYLKDNVELYLENGAVLKASENLDDYNDDDAYEQNWGSKNEGWKAKHLIIAHECKNTAITGLGVIDGSADFFYSKDKKMPKWPGYAWEGGFVHAKDPEILRPGQLICFIESENIQVQNITIQNATCWCCYMHGCEFVQIRGIKVKNPPEHANTDGLDIDCCRFVTVSDCIISTGDDAIAIRCDSKRLKKPKPCEHITITNCILKSNSSAFRIGVGYGEIRHIRVSNITVPHAGTLITYTTSYLGWGRADIEDISFDNISGDDIGLLMDCQVQCGTVVNASMQNMRIKSQAGIIMRANGEGKIRGITLKDIEHSVKTIEKKIKENYVIAVENADDVLIDGLRLCADLKEWDGVFSDVNCKNLIKRNCVFSE